MGIWARPGMGGCTSRAPLGRRSPAQAMVQWGREKAGLGMWGHAGAGVKLQLGRVLGGSSKDATGMAVMDWDWDSAWTSVLGSSSKDVAGMAVIPHRPQADGSDRAALRTEISSHHLPPCSSAHQPPSPIPTAAHSHHPPPSTAARSRHPPPLPHTATTPNLSLLHVAATPHLYRTQLQPPTFHCCT